MSSDEGLAVNLDLVVAGQQKLFYAPEEFRITIFVHMPFSMILVHPQLKPGMGRRGGSLA
ncbi:MAG: hypothetical protein AVDCRST_MAG93-669 [uncultured Chloroflexia bacterium]|uniref:Uncharacterized protein n=1 Tax=uncultured Chloroflexia bacterium TaxID=1672391 RepID=A0A6J4HKR2_9CHLR|nr:MAG: hypothetical protein AVDCRST_MAG93-669 [uncultured Chloroflexia bacterium]